jgi:hypothetical protein
MEWTRDEMDRLYGLYRQLIDRLRADIAKANQSLGSLKPDQTGLDHITCAEFEALLNYPDGDAEAVDLWVQRIVRGHEHEFPRLRTEKGSFLDRCADTGTRRSQVRQRNTGT